MIQANPTRELDFLIIGASPTGIQPTHRDELVCFLDEQLTVGSPEVDQCEEPLLSRNDDLCGCHIEVAASVNTIDQTNGNTCPTSRND